jgi:hypothetical protein
MQPSFFWVLIERNFPAWRQECRSGAEPAQRSFREEHPEAWLLCAVQTGAARCPSGTRKFETCPHWVPAVDKRRRCARIDLKTISVHGFDHRHNGTARVRNVSNLGSQRLHNSSNRRVLAPADASPSIRRS